MASRHFRSESNPELPTYASLLAELKEAHERLLNAMAELDRITREDVPHKVALTSARWRLSRASLTRRMLWAQILSTLREIVGPRTANILRRLQDMDIGLLNASTRHVHNWPTEAILGNWPGYCDASREMRWKMAAAIRAEKRLLYPILQSMSGS